MNHETMVDFFVFSTRSSLFPEVVRVILRALCKLKWLRPDVWGFDTPFVNAFDESKLDQVMSAFSDRSVWDPLALQDHNDRFSYLIGRDQNSDGFWVASGGFETSYLASSLEAEKELEFLVDQIVLESGADYAQIANPDTPGAKVPFHLRMRLPDIQNIIYLGPACVREFGHDHISNSRPEGVEWLNSETAKIRVNQTVLSPLSPEEQEPLRMYFGEDYFKKHPKRRYKTGKSPFSVE